MNRQHNYALAITWTGNKGEGTSNYRAYERSYTIEAEGKMQIGGSSDPAFRGDKTKYNPEDLLVASLSSCHMLFYLHLCAEAGIVVTDYSDQATGLMEETPNGGGAFKEVTLNPHVIITDESMLSLAMQLHQKAGELCFIASSVNFKVLHRPLCQAISDISAGRQGSEPGH